MIRPSTHSERVPRASWGRGWALSALLLVSSVSPAGAGPPAEDITIIVNKDSSVRALSLDALRTIFQGRRMRWSKDDVPVVPINRPVSAEVRKAFYDRVHGTSAEKQFRRRGSPFPVQFMVQRSRRATTRMVRGLAGAIGYVNWEGGEGLQDVRVVRVDGKLPGQAGYPLRYERKGKK